MTQEQGFAGKTMDFLIPGYKGYRIAEERREQDKLVREYLAGELDRGLSSVSRVVLEFTKAGKLEMLSDLNSLKSRLEKCRDTILYADRGYTGWFSTRVVDQETLDRLFGFDEALAGNAKNVVRALGLLATAVKNSDLYGKTFEEAGDSIDEFDRALGERANILKEF
jgi:hypothetical protein